MLICFEALSIKQCVVGFSQSILFGFSFQTSAAHSASPLRMHSWMVRDIIVASVCVHVGCIYCNIIIRLCASEKRIFPFIEFGLVYACEKWSMVVFGETSKLYIRIYKLVVIAKCYHHDRSRIFEYKFQPVCLVYWVPFVGAVVVIILILKLKK